MNIHSDIKKLLADIDNPDLDLMTREEIQKLIDKYGWKKVHDGLVEVLKSDNYEDQEYRDAACALAFARDEGLVVDVDLVCGLVYKRLPPNSKGTVDPDAWGFVSMIKGVSYMDSDYDPRKDPSVIKALKDEGIDCSDWEEATQGIK